MALILKPDPEAIIRAVEVLRNGGVIIFPTETVYGIGADLRQPQAIERIYAIKGRSLDLRLLVHCADESQVKGVVREIPEPAGRLIDAFLPGPLALILYRSPLVPDIVTAGGETVGIRIVDNPYFAAIARTLGAPLAGTSANLSGAPPTNEFRAIDPEIIARCDLALDAGVAGSGRPSTIIDLTRDPPVILRAGEIDPAQLQAVLKLK
ncbi:MAG: L-threonylcarbamoyladenylate synthase [candidate division WOR-3 bacterium]|uniref:L-threonylcarbamoyladenylate synthase n=1 Tax=candidate division WOR-3 bacterium TaxID=2052148 RepID=A0A7C1T1M6_UNCW3|nr:L-threonylcarbamoyladenylate synthase [candidate division WOR-3 bacterium]